MKDIQHVIEALLAKRAAGFRNKQLADALGVSRGRASQLLAPRLLSGELSRTRFSRGLYVRGRDCWQGAGCVARGAPSRGFWRSLVERYPELAYLSLLGLGLTSLRTRHQVRTAVRGLLWHQRFLIVDFQGIQSISLAASHELFCELPRTELLTVEPINLEPVVAQIVWRTLRSSH